MRRAAWLWARGEKPARAKLHAPCFIKSNESQPCKLLCCTVSLVTTLSLLLPLEASSSQVMSHSMEYLLPQLHKSLLSGGKALERGRGGAAKCIGSKNSPEKRWSQRWVRQGEIYRWCRCTNSWNPSLLSWLGVSISPGTGSSLMVLRYKSRGELSCSNVSSCIQNKQWPPAGSPGGCEAHPHIHTYTPTRTVSPVHLIRTF